VPWVDATTLGHEPRRLILAATRESPTLADHIAAVARTFTDPTAATYGTYWRLAIELLGHRRLAEITLADLQAVVAETLRRAQARRPGSPGRSAQETCIAALRALFDRALAAGLVAANPAKALTKPRRARSRRRALTDTELAELIDAVRVTSNDPDLDLLLVRFHLESGARRQGALNLRCGDIDPHRSTVWLREKDTSDREQPISPALTALLQHHAVERGARHPNDPVFRRRNRQPISTRRYNTLFDRARACLPWTDRTPASAHVLRHTAITAVGRLAGYPVAQTFAGHTPPSVTGQYLQATLEEVATAIATLTNQPHPLATTTPSHRTTKCRRPARP
jgi:integrase/recombinase XerC